MRHIFSTRLIKIAIAMAALGVATSAPARDASLFDLNSKWTEDSGAQVSMERWKGKPILITMAYSTCRKTCYLSLKKLEQFQSELDQKKLDAEIVIVSYDPKNDTPETWAEYRNTRSLHRKNWHFLTGNEQGTKQLSRFLGLADFWSYGGHILHDFKIAVVDADGVITKQVDWKSLQVGSIF